jgi:pimeloyl-ACP methyl ester carboxylesterase
VPFADVGGKELWYEEAGSGPALVLIHEAVADSTMWDDHVPAFAERHRVIRYDLPGFGRSPLPPGPLTFVDDLAALLDQLDVEHASVVGVSMGGRIALEYAIVHPDRVDALVLVAPGLPGREQSEALARADEEEDELMEQGDVEGAAQLAVRVWLDGPHRSPDEVDPAVRERALEMNRRAYAVQIPAYAATEQPGPVVRLDPPAAERLEEVRAPTLVIVPELDHQDIIDVCELLAAGIPGARKVVMPGVAHMAPIERPEEFTRLLLDFLDR